MFVLDPADFNMFFPMILEINLFYRENILPFSRGRINSFSHLHTYNNSSRLIKNPLFLWKTHTYTHNIHRFFPKDKFHTIQEFWAASAVS